jgi:hypothetical protein
VLSRVRPVPSASTVQIPHGVGSSQSEKPAEHDPLAVGGEAGVAVRRHRSEVVQKLIGVLPVGIRDPEAAVPVRRLLVVSRNVDELGAIGGIAGVVLLHFGCIRHALQVCPVALH